MRTVSKPKLSPFYGIYRAPDGSELHLCRPSDVYDLFRALLDRMPEYPTVYTKRNPEKRFRVLDGKLTPLP